MRKTTVLFTPREKLLEGVETMAGAVASTLGPMGQNVALVKATNGGEIFERIVVHDGVSVARTIDIPDEQTNTGAQLLKQAAQKQVDEVGDGTTVVMILAHAIISQAFQQIAAGAQPMSLRKPLEEGAKRLTDHLKTLGTPISTLKDMTHIATISAEDAELGALVAKTMHEIGRDGVVTVEESKNQDTTVEHQDGMQFDKGYLHPLFVTDPERMEATLERPLLFITDKVINNLLPLKTLLEAVHASGRPLCVIAPDFTGEAPQILAQNKLQGALSVLCVKAPSFGQVQKDMLQDMAILTGATFITEDGGYRLEDLTLEHLGSCQYVKSSRTATTIVGGKGNKKELKERVQVIRELISKETSDFESDKLKERLAKLTTGVSIIHVGGHTEVEMRERKERALDAVAATHAALEMGVVAGGETIYLRIRELVKDIPILYRALYAPFKRLLENAGLNDGEYYAEMKGKQDVGVDVNDATVKNLTKAGIIDPVAVSYHAIHNAVSVAVQIMTTGITVTPYVEEKKA